MEEELPIKPYSFEEYSLLCNGKGVFNHVDIILSYRLYMVIMTGTEKQISKVIEDCVANNLYYLSHRFN